MNMHKYRSDVSQGDMFRYGKAKKKYPKVWIIQREYSRFSYFMIRDSFELSVKNRERSVLFYHMQNINKSARLCNSLNVE